MTTENKNTTQVENAQIPHNQNTKEPNEIKTDNVQSTNTEFENQFNSLYNDIMQMLAIKAQMQNKQNNQFLPQNEENSIPSQPPIPSQTPSTIITNKPSTDTDNYKQLLQQFNNYK